MKQLISKMILAVFAVQMIVPVAIAQDYGRQFDRPLTGNTGLGSSFRRTDQLQLEQSIMEQGDASSESLRAKGMLMTEPSMSGLMYQVHILGEVKMPGTYRITASDRLSEVLKKAGGVDEQGSERNIEVRR